MSKESTVTTRRRQWFGFIASPVAWTVYFVLVYVLDEEACKQTLLSPTAVLPITTVLTVITLGVIGYAGWLAGQAWLYGDGGGSGQFLGLTGLFLCGLFVLATVGVWVTALVLMPC